MKYSHRLFIVTALLAFHGEEYPILFSLTGMVCDGNCLFCVVCSTFKNYFIATVVFLLSCLLSGREHDFEIVLAGTLA